MRLERSHISDTQRIKINFKTSRFFFSDTVKMHYIVYKTFPRFMKRLERGNARTQRPKNEDPYDIDFYINGMLIIVSKNEWVKKNQNPAWMIVNVCLFCSSIWLLRLNSSYKLKPADLTANPHQLEPQLILFYASSWQISYNTLFQLLTPALAFPCGCMEGHGGALSLLLGMWMGKPSRTESYIKKGEDKFLSIESSWQNSNPVVLF